MGVAICQGIIVDDIPTGRNLVDENSTMVKLSWTRILPVELPSTIFLPVELSSRESYQFGFYLDHIGVRLVLGYIDRDLLTE